MDGLTSFSIVSNAPKAQRSHRERPRVASIVGWAAQGRASYQISAVSGQQHAGACAGTGRQARRVGTAHHFFHYRTIRHQLVGNAHPTHCWVIVCGPSQRGTRQRQPLARGSSRHGRHGRGTLAPCSRMVAHAPADQLLRWMLRDELVASPARPRLPRFQFGQRPTQRSAAARTGSSDRDSPKAGLGLEQFLTGLPVHGAQAA